MSLIRLTVEKWRSLFSESEGKKIMLKVKITKLGNLSVLCVAGRSFAVKLMRCVLLYSRKSMLPVGNS
jgi:hypothetical protein